MKLTSKIKEVIKNETILQEQENGIKDEKTKNNYVNPTYEYVDDNFHNLENKVKNGSDSNKDYYDYFGESIEYSNKLTTTDKPTFYESDQQMAYLPERSKNSTINEGLIAYDDRKFNVSTLNAIFQSSEGRSNFSDHPVKNITYKAELGIGCLFIGISIFILIFVTIYFIKSLKNLVSSPEKVHKHSPIVRWYK